MTFSTISLPMRDGWKLAVYSWPGEGVAANGGGRIKGAVQITHGMAEHALRYDHVAQALVKAGYVVYAEDHRGHGQTARTDADLGYFAASDGWSKIIDDMYQLNRYISERHPGVPIVLFGHSMGSFMVQDYLIRHGETIAAAVLSGTNSGAGSTAKAGSVIAKIERLRLGPRGHSKLVQMLSTGHFNNRFKPLRTDHDWLSRDPVEVDKYRSDPRCGFLLTVQAWIDVLSGLVRIDDPKNQARVPKGLPILLFSGSEDPVGGEGKGVLALAKTYERLGLSRVTCKLYPGGRHEMVNEINRDEVIADLVSWIDANVPSVSATTGANAGVPIATPNAR